MPDNIASAIAAPSAAPAAPSAPPPSAPPAAPPAAPAAAPPSAPGTTPVTSTPSAPVSDGTQAPPAPSGPQPPTAPNPSDFGNATDWYMANTAYQAELQKFKEEHPEVEIPEVKPVETKPEVTPEPEQQTEEKPAEEQPKPEDAEQLTLDDVPDMTPQAFNDLLKANPEREAYMNKDVELKNTMMRMARENSRAQEMLKIYPTAESAKYAKGVADRRVTIEAKFQQAETPEQWTAAFDDFAQEFAITGADGKPVMDAEGNIQYADDFYGMMEHIVRDRFLQGDLEEIQARLDANQYATPEDRVRDEDELIATQIKMAKFSGDKPKDPDLSQVPENLRADMQKRLDDVKRREAELDAKSGKATKEARKQERAQANTDYYNQIGERTYAQVNQTLDAMRKAGVLIPEWQLKTTVPGTNIPAFYQQVGIEVEKLLRSDPYTWKTLADLEAAPPTPENMKARVQTYDEVLNRADHKGVSNIKAIVKKLVRGFGADVTKQANSQPEPTTTASKEPRGGGPVTPRTMTRDDAYRQAVKDLSKEVPNWNDLAPNEQMGLALTRQMQLMSAKR